MSWTVRPAVLSDARAMEMLHAAAFDAVWTRADFEGWLSRPEGFGALAFDSAGGPAAFALALQAGDDAEILAIASRPDLRRTGAARAVFRCLDAEAGRRGLDRWLLEVAVDNTAARSLYLSEDFVEIARRAGYYERPGGAIDAYVMSRAVGTPPAGRTNSPAAGSEDAML